jgi:hypothetical protein
VHLTALKQGASVFLTNAVWKCSVFVRMEGYYLKQRLQDITSDQHRDFLFVTQTGARACEAILS